jgi:hypothetical protein
MAAAGTAQQLKMRLRMIINAILDARVHASGMLKAEAMAPTEGVRRKAGAAVAGRSFECAAVDLLRRLHRSERSYCRTCEASG